MRLLPLDNKPTLVPLLPQEPLRLEIKPIDFDTFTDATETVRHTTAGENKRVNPYNLQLNLNTLMPDKFKIKVQQPNTANNKKH